MPLYNVTQVELVHSQEAELLFPRLFSNVLILAHAWPSKIILMYHQDV